MSLKKPQGQLSKVKRNTATHLFQETWVCVHAGKFAKTITEGNKHGQETRVKCCSCPMQTSFGILKVTTCIAMTDHDDGIRKSLKFVWPEIQSSYACFIFYRLSGGIFLLLLVVLLRKTNRMYFQSSSCVFTLTKIISRKQKTSWFNLPSLSTKCAQYFTDLGNAPVNGF